MATDPIFTALLSTNLDNVTKPPALPATTYYGVIDSYKLDKSKNQQTPYVKFTFKGLTPHEDALQDSINGPILESIDFSKKTLNKDFWLSADAMWRLKAFLTSLGLNTTGKTPGELIPMSVGAPVLLTVTQRNSEDGEEIYNDVSKVTGRP